MAGATLCIIGGSPRSGTRNFTDLANAHPNIKLFGEVGNRALALTNDAMAELEGYHAGEVAHRAARGKAKTARRYNPHELTLSLLAMYAKTPVTPYNPRSFESGVVGFKTPQIERQWSVLTRMFEGFASPKNFFFCMRNVDQNYLSLHSCGWRKDFAEYSARLIPLLRAVLEFKTWSEEHDEEWRIKVLHLDDYLASPEKVDWLSDKFFGVIAPRTSRRNIDRFISSVTNRNSTERLTGEERRKVLTDEERRAIESASEISDLLASLNTTFGVNIAMLTESSPEKKSQSA